ncbi:ATP-binding protein [Phenylobacterium sp.]|uniref:ATP-binding protein n=1 Tax=Phenylobacterium sp. TaxID=1871053 RepID=UPI00120F9C56|nr:ATP-binding protein [Phenylobacterium sp.]THD57478.1 MAG: PAS domain S-box protein [Phenylobacterium sp.]
MKVQYLPGLELADDMQLVNFDLGPLGLLKLESIRPSALRAGRLAEQLFGAPEADMIAVQGGRVWRGKRAGQHADDAAAMLIAQHANEPYWISDAQLDPDWRDHPGVRDGLRIRFCAAAPIHLWNGGCLGALRVFDIRPRPYDAAMAAGLADLADFVADECNRLLGGEVRRIRELFDHAPGFLAILTGPEHVFELINAAGTAFIGDRDVLGQPIGDVLPEFASQGLLALIHRVYERGTPYAARAAKILLQRTADGPMQAAYADFVLQPIRGAEDVVTGVFCQGHEVTREKLAADELEAGRRQLEAALSVKQTIFDHSLDVISTIDAQGRFTKVSKHAEDLWGYPPHELLGRPYIDFVHPDDVAATTAIAVEIVRGVPTKAFTNRYMHRDGTAVPVMWSAVWSVEHQTMFAVARDMREHEAAEDKLRQAQKMEAVGQLTGGVAHDFNNLLTVVIGSAELLSEGLADSPDLEPLAQLVLDAAERGADLVSRLLAFSRQQPLRPQTVDCAALFKSLTPLLQRTLGSNIHIDVAAPHGLACLADPTQLTSALLNLSINARDAMPEGGRLSIRARLEPSKGCAGASDTAADADLVVLTVEDTGEGMTEAVVKRVLEPFFTTKAVGKGSGLGLSMVYGFANQSGGRLEITSAPGVGTAISLYLPVPALQIVSAPEPQEVIAPPVARHILLVEDDDLLRRQVERQLTALGYRVTAREDGPGALRRLGEASDIDLLMTDIVMPGGINGRQLATRAQDIIPGLRTLFTSGFSDHASLSSELVERADFLAKPYRRAELARRLEMAFADG